MKLAEFISEMGFEQKFSDRIAELWDNLPELEVMPKCFINGFFEQYSSKLGVPTPFESEIPELNARAAKSPALKIYANLIVKAIFYDKDFKLNTWPAPEKLLTKKQCGLFNLMIALSMLPLVEKSYNKLNLPQKHLDGVAEWIGGTIAIYAAAHDGIPGHSLNQIHWLKNYIDNRLFRIGRFEYLIHSAEDWLPAIYRSKKSGHTVALCREGWKLTQQGYQTALPKVGETPVKPYKVAHLDNINGKVEGIPINPTTGLAELEETMTLDLSEYYPVLSAHEWVPGLHIPAGGGMTIELAKESLLEAKDFFRKYFRKEIKAFTCDSWIFNPAWLTEIPESNLARFMQELYLTPLPERTREGVFFVYGRDDGDLASYPADNSLRQAFRRIIDSGQPLRSGGMFILTDDLERFGTGTYKSHLKP